MTTVDRPANKPAPRPAKRARATPPAVGQAR